MGAQRLRQGWLLTADYGFLQDDFFSPHRARGTLRAYSKHHARTDLLEAVGEQDITAHVNFSLLMKNFGWNTVGRTVRRNPPAYDTRIFCRDRIR